MFCILIMVVVLYALFKLHRTVSKESKFTVYKLYLCIWHMTHCICMFIYMKMYLLSINYTSINVTYIKTYIYKIYVLYYLVLWVKSIHSVVFFLSKKINKNSIALAQFYEADQWNRIEIMKKTTITLFMLKVVWQSRWYIKPFVWILLWQSDICIKK